MTMQAGVVETLLILEISNYAFIGAGSSVRITLTNVTVLSKWILIFSWKMCFEHVFFLENVTYDTFIPFNPLLPGVPFLYPLKSSGGIKREHRIVMG